MPLAFSEPPEPITESTEDASRSNALGLQRFNRCVWNICNELGGLPAPTQNLVLLELARRFPFPTSLATLSEHQISHRPTLGELLLAVVKSDAFQYLEIYPNPSTSQGSELQLTLRMDDE